MESLSRPLVDALKAVERAGHYSAEELPSDLSIDRVRYLVSEGLVDAVTLEPPGHNGYPLGLSGYQISEKGRNAVCLYKESKRKELLSGVMLYVNLLIGGAVTLFFEHIETIAEWARKILVQLVP